MRITKPYIYRYFFIIMVSIGLVSCVMPEKPAPAPAKPVVKVKPQPKPKPKAEPVLPKVAVVLSNDSVAFSGLGKLLIKQLGKRAKLYNMDGDATKGGRLRKQIQAADHEQVVAVGLLAAQMASTLKKKQVVFCKVFNYKDNDLLRPWMKGVSMMPPPDKVFSAWKAIDPKLNKVAIVTGLNQGDFITSVRRAGQKYGIDVLHKVVRNDNEFSFASKSMKGVRAQWLVPDNRVLSRTALLDVLNHGVKKGRQIMAFDPSLLKFGALASVRAIDQDIAKKVMSKLRFSMGKSTVFGKNVAPVHKVELKISAKSLKRLDLKIPEKYKTAVQ